MERVGSYLKLKTAKSARDLSQFERKEYPTDAAQYDLLDDCGRGVSATVHKAFCKPFNEIVAVKKMNLDTMNCNLEEIIHEAATMRQYNHPNVLPLYTSFVQGADLWMVMPFIAGGSVLHIMKYKFPDGLDEPAIATIMRDVLKALDYVHKNGGIHRDVKAGNILIDQNGVVKLADFGVAATMERGGSWGNDKIARMTFVGTPCWMAPEVMEQTQGYDSSADIWSVGITILELAHGHAPFAKFPPMKVLLMTLQNPPPTLDDKGTKHFSKTMRDVVGRCLNKDATKRPSAAQLLEHKFFKQAKDEDYLVKQLLGSLPPLEVRVQMIRSGKAATNVTDNDRNQERSQEEYVKGVSSWNFDVQALKKLAANEPDEEFVPPLAPIREGNEDTYSGTTSSLPPRPPGSLTSAFAAAAVVALEGATSAPLPVLSTGTAATLKPDMSVEEVSLSGMADALSVPPASAAVPAAVPATLTVNLESSAVFSPEGNSPHMSREGSSQGPLNILASTPNAVKQKKGRFVLYGEGEIPPPMSPPSTTILTETSSLNNSLRGEPQTTTRPNTDVRSFSEARVSDGGQRPEDKLESFASSAISVNEVKVEGEAASIEPKMRGRFKIIEEEPPKPSLPKASSSINLSDTIKSRSDSGSKPGTLPPVTVLLPKLQELLEHAAVHQAAIQKLITAVQEPSKNLNSVLNRSLNLSGRSLPSPDAELVEDLKTQISDLKSRLLSTEEENGRLKQRVAELAKQVAVNPSAASVDSQSNGPQAGGAGLLVPVRSLTSDTSAATISSSGIPPGPANEKVPL